MNYQELANGLGKLPPDIRSYVERALNHYHNQTTTSVKRLYLEVLEEHMGWIEAIHYLGFLDDDDWQTVYEYAEGEKE